MADRRMFTRKVTDDDHFLSLSSSAQALYLHLSMAADDDGFNNQVSVAMFRAHASVQDLQSLLEARYVYQFDTGVIVIKHWRMANALRKDRYTPTVFQEELAKLQLKENGSYTWLPSGCQVVAERLPSGCHSTVQYSTDKDSIDQYSTGTVQGEPSLEEIRRYALEIKSKTDPERFFSYYSGRWSSVRDWRALFRSWSASDAKKAAAPAPAPQRKGNYFQQPSAGSMQAMSWEEWEAQGIEVDEED